jgi:3-oxoacyl-(acyl-carrier-protein) synthase III
MIPVRILGTASVLPGRAVSTIELAEKFWPGRDPAEIVARTGISSRFWADPGTTTTSLAIETLGRALEAADCPPEEVKRLILVNCSGGDTVLPATSSLVAGGLGLRGTCDCMDLSNACSGFMTALDVGARSVATGLYPVAIVVAEVLSPHLNPEDRRTSVVFGDAGAAVVLGPGRPGEGLLSSWLRNDGVLRGSVNLDRGKVTIGESCWTPEPTFVSFGVSNAQITQEATDAILLSTQQALDEAGLVLDDVRWVLIHQPNGRMYRSIVDQLGVEEDRLVDAVDQVGSIAAASLPLCLDRLMTSGRVAPGDHILLAGVGSGISYGGMIYRVAP